MLNKEKDNFVGFSDFSLMIKVDGQLFTVLHLGVVMFIQVQI